MQGQPVLFQYFSDLHTEAYYDKSNFVGILPVARCAPNLIVAGDLGCPTRSLFRQALARFSLMFDHVFFVAGNHEYYRARDIPAAERKIRDICETFPNVHFLQDEGFELSSGVAVYGTTLWSDVKPEEEPVVTKMIADYRLIPHFTPQVSRDLFRKSVAALEDFLSSASKPVVIVTHHLPSYDLLDRDYSACGYNSAFASDLSSFLAGHRGSIAAWVAGHTHAPTEQGLFHVNPIGDRLSPKSNLNKTFSIFTLDFAALVR